MGQKPYQAKSLAGAQRRVRELQKLVHHLDKRLGENARQLVAARQDAAQMAMLAADGPAFYNPLIVVEAKQRRDEILKGCGINPDGSPLSKGARP